MSGITSQLPTTPPDLAGFKRRLVKRLERFRQRVRQQLLLEGAVRVLATSVALLLLSLLIDWSLRLSLPMRLICLLAIIAAIAYELWRHVLHPARMELTYLDLASMLDGRTIPNATAITNNPVGAARFSGQRSVLAPRIATVLQLSESAKEQASAGASPAMIERAVARSFESLQAVDFEARIETRRRMNAFVALAIALLVPLILTIAIPSSVGLWAKRWFFASNQPWPQKTYLEVVGLRDDGRIIVPRGEPYVLRLATKPSSVSIPESVSLKLKSKDAKAASATMTRFGNDTTIGDFRHELLTVTSPLTVTAWGGDDALEPFVIEPVDRPKIAKLELIAKHPTDAKPQTIDFSGQAAPSYLPKTQIELRLTSNVPLREARVLDVAKTQAATQPAAAIPALKRVDETTYAMSWMHDAPVSFEVELTASAGGLTSPPTPISIGLKIDQPPRVSIQHSGVRQRVSPMAKIPLALLARDDYGIAELNLAWKADLDAAGTTQPVSVGEMIKLAGPFTPASELEIQKPHTLELAALKLVPNMLLSLTGEATDANYLGVQTGKSRALAFRIVAPEELFREILSRQQGERAKFRKAIDDMKSLRDQMQTLTAGEGVGAIARQYRIVHRESARIHKSLDDSLTEMKLNALGGVDAYTLLQNNVLAPLKTLNDERLTQQRDAIDVLGRNFSDTSLSETTGKQDEVVAEMERILKQMSQWDSFVDVLNQLNEVIKIQENARETTEKMRTTETEGVFEP